MNITVWVNAVDLTASALLPQTRIKRELSGRVSTAELAFRIADVTLVSEAMPVEILDESAGVRFRGTVTRVSQKWISPDLVDVSVTCADFTPLLDELIITNATFFNKSDRQIVQAIAGFVTGFTAIDANVAVLVPNIAEFTIKDRTAKEALEDLCKLTTGEYYVDFNKGIHYFSADGVTPAPFDLSTDGGTVDFAVDGYTREFSRCINSCTFLGAYVAGAELRVVYEDPVSIAAYGKHGYVLVDRDIDVGTVASLKAKAVVEASAYPKETANVTLYTDGLDVGQTVDVTHSIYGLFNVPFLVRSLDISWDEAGTVYSAELGDPAPTTERLVAALDARTRAAKSVPTGIPASGSVTDASIAPGGISAVSIGSVSADKITGQITAGQIHDVNATSINGTLSSTQIGSIDATTITGAITATQIESVNATSIHGVIVSSQVANDLIDSLAKLAPALRPIPQLATEPGLPSANYPEGSVYLNTTTGLYRKVVSGAWATVTESTAIAGKFTYALLGSLKASSITGLIAAGQIGTVNASSINGAITAAQIESVNASSITGNISATKIEGGITATQITGVYVGALQQGGGGTGYLSPALVPGGGFSDNLAFNGGFESGTANWDFFKGSLQPNNFVVVSNQASARSGGKVLAHALGGTTGTDSYAACSSNPFTKVVAGEQYTLESWVYREAGCNGTLYIYIDAFNETAYVGQMCVTSAAASIPAGTWVKLSASGVPPAGATQARITIILYDHTAGTNWRLDDIALYRKISGAQIQPLTINATHITSVNAGVIAGPITAGQIESVNASSISGTITSSQIGSLTATKITGTLNATQIGTITAGQIGSVNAASITIGLVQNGQIQGVSASKLTAGTIDASVINVINLNASNISTGSMVADRIAAGTISAAVTLTSPTIVVTGSGFRVNIDSTNGVKVQAVGTGGFSAMASTSISANNGFTQCDVRGDGVYVSNNRIIGSRQARPSDLAGVISVLIAHGLTS